MDFYRQISRLFQNKRRNVLSASSMCVHHVHTSSPSAFTFNRQWRHSTSKYGLDIISKSCTLLAPGRKFSHSNMNFHFKGTANNIDMRLQKLSSASGCAMGWTDISISSLFSTWDSSNVKLGCRQFSSTCLLSAAGDETLSLEEISELDFQGKCDETLDSLAERFEDIADTQLVGPDFVVEFAQGVLTVKFGPEHGTYVINKQTPNKQIWLSSPSSGPKRYDFVKGVWVYRHDGSVLHDLLTKEISKMLNGDIDFSKCTFGKLV